MPFYDLSDKECFAVFVKDLVELVNKNPVKWEITLDANNIMSRCKEQSLIAAYSAIMDAYAESLHKETWICKSLQNVHFLDEIMDFFGEAAKFIYLYRDGRDVCLSFMKAPVGHKTAYHIAK